MIQNIFYWCLDLIVETVLCSEKKMARVIENKGRKKFITDVKMGKRWQLTARRERKKEGEKKDEGTPNLSWIPQRKRRGDSGLALLPSGRSGCFRKPWTS